MKKFGISHFLIAVVLTLTLGQQLVIKTLISTTNIQNRTTNRLNRTNGRQDRMINSQNREIDCLKEEIDQLVIAHNHLQEQLSDLYEIREEENRLCIRQPR